VEPKLCEPEKCEGWEWTMWEHIAEIVQKPESGAGAKRLFQPMIEFVTQRPDFEPFRACLA